MTECEHTLGFRPVAEPDLRALNRIVNDPDVGRFLMLQPPVSLESTRRLYHECIREGALWYAIVADGCVVGSVLLRAHSKESKQSHVAEVGIELAKDYWSRGIGAKAVEFILGKAKELKIKRLELAVAQVNLRARRLYLRHGFKVEGTKRKAYIMKGRYHNLVLMARMIP